MGRKPLGHSAEPLCGLHALDHKVSSHPRRLRIAQGGVLMCRAVGAWRNCPAVDQGLDLHTGLRDLPLKSDHHARILCDTCPSLWRAAGGLQGAALLRRAAGGREASPPAGQR